ncbi:hypothetical protein [Salibacterium lacus]|uniref:Uncharacterized protein n=1 Tax=Salibacterium lacus TaxID=1898109 RepID=A0ABW5T0D4_9BACI
MEERQTRVEYIEDETRTARSDAERANTRIDAVEQRLDEHDAKWREDRTEKRWVWTAIIAIVGTIGVPIIIAFI